MAQPILFYDGDCGFCQKIVQFILKNEKEAYFLFAPLQGETARKELPEHLTKELDSVVVKWDTNVFVKTQAVIFVSGYMTFPYRLAKIGNLLPRAILDKCYDFVAKNRHNIVKSSTYCKVLTVNERMRMLP